MEYEVRFYYNSKELNNILEKFRSISDLRELPRTYEKTTQYNHCDKRFNFYSDEIDGRFRIRVSKNDIETKSMLS